MFNYFPKPHIWKSQKPLHGLNLNLITSSYLAAKFIWYKSTHTSWGRAPHTDISFYCPLTTQQLKKKPAFPLHTDPSRLVVSQETITPNTNPWVCTLTPPSLQQRLEETFNKLSLAKANGTGAPPYKQWGIAITKLSPITKISGMEDREVLHLVTSVTYNLCKKSLRFNCERYRNCRITVRWKTFLF